MPRVKKTKEPLLILGTGMASAYALQAAKDAGVWPIRVISDRMHSMTQPGAVWLHWLPEHMRFQYEEERILVKSIGNGEVYIEKQWGPDVETTSSFPTATRIETGWLPEKVLPEIW